MQDTDTTEIENDYFTLKLRGNWVEEPTEHGYSYRNDKQSKQLTIQHGIAPKVWTPEEKIEVSKSAGRTRLQALLELSGKTQNPDRLVLEPLGLDIVFKYHECAEELGLSVGFIVCVYDKAVVSIMITDHMSIDSKASLSLVETIFDGFDLK